jgi:sugar O-acyltransferase (sialic acid O-acetyltransferase NeuD family)
MKKSIVIGTGGHSRVIIDALEKNNQNIYGFIELNFNKHSSNEKIFGYKILGNINNIKDFSKYDFNFYLAIGDSNNRKDVFTSLKKYNFNYPKLIHPSAIVSSRASIKKGSFINAGSIINAGVLINNFCIINTGSTIDHESKVGSFSQICPGVNVAGRVKIGSNCFIGIGSKLIENISIKSNVIIGAGSVVTKSILKKGTYAGIPAIFLQ